MIVTLTLNPSLDRTLFVGDLVRGGLNRVTFDETEAAGKGVNVARALHRSGSPTMAVVPCGGSTGDELLRQFQAEQLPVEIVHIQGETRSNVSLVETDAVPASGCQPTQAGAPRLPTVTKLDCSGPELSTDELSQLMGAVLDRVRPGSWIVASGSIPRGVSSDVYADLSRRVHDAGGQFAVDTSGKALEAVLAQPPALLKPNSHELAALIGAPITNVGDAVKAAQILVDGGVPQVLASLGEQGAVLTTKSGTLFGVAPTTQAVNTVGAGDALLAGYLAAGACGSASLRVALSWARAAVRSATTAFQAVEPSDVAAASVSTCDNSAGSDTAHSS